MSENSNKVNSVEKKGGFKALKQEFKKIMWPDKSTISSKTVAVIITTTVLSLLIAVIDYLVDLALATLG